jgi:hypothetical protein
MTVDFTINLTETFGFQFTVAKKQENAFLAKTKNK